ncbi:hypothetical protein MLD38_023506 [Melastoma candidum]|uniref:Uncharacterized protein n=2 Tax=Melastoma candidum TaxID=119954 RepID=A0ACB9NQR9_9MYRT|nr:hypothetical protein MLD38_023506 [Melastoma candidum]
MAVCTMNPTTPGLHKLYSHRSSFKSRMSILNSAESSTRKHLTNLDRLLQTPPPPSPADTTTETPCVVQKPKPLDIAAGNNGISSGKKKKGIFEGLNLSSVWSELKATAEEVSPRHFKRLQRLLSKTNEYSPRNHLGSRWREYHGSNSWEGLLDPLDQNLRREVVRYGEMIQAAYQTFNSDPAMPTDELPAPHHVTLPDGSYKVTKSLYATSSVGLPKWVDEMAPDLGWMTQRSSWIGYVAVCDDQREIARMGRRDIVIALRGTATCLEWAENFRAKLVEIEDDVEKQDNNGNADRSDDNGQGKAKVQCGFRSLYRTPGAYVPSLAESVVEEVRRLIKLYKGETLSITVTGHSLGAALSLLVTDELSTSIPDVPPIAVFSFGGPRVGNRAFADRVNAKNIKVLRIVNDQDVITRVPGVFLGEEVEQKLRKARLEGMPWDYEHVGAELRLDMRTSPYLKPNADVACCHDLEAYLHLVDGFSGSDSPFRENAKRSLWKLVKEQRSNVKKLYKSKARALTLNLERERIVGPPMITCLPSPS